MASTAAARQCAGLVCSAPVLPALRRHAAPTPRLAVVRAAGGGQEDLPTIMTLERAHEVLGTSPAVSFEAVVTAKNKLLAAQPDNAMEIETAYDMLFSASMRKRLSGELEVSTSVRYADVPPSPSRKASAPRSSSGSRPGAGPAMRGVPRLPSAPSDIAVSVAVPRNAQLAGTQAAVFGGLALWAALGAVLESPEAQLADTAGFQLALSMAYAIYTLKENKRMSLGKAVGLAMGCLVVGAVLGTVTESWLRVDIVPILGFSSPGVLVAEFVIAACAAGAIFLF